jgi:hypothetical protein
MAKTLTVLGFALVIAVMWAAGAYDGYLNGFYSPSGAAWWALRSLGAIAVIAFVGLAFSRLVDWIGSRRARR